MFNSLLSALSLRQGRMKRLAYLFSGIVVMLPMLVALPLFMFDNLIVIIVAIVLAVFSAYLSLLFMVRRIHDIGLSGWYAVPYFVISMCGSVLFENREAWLAGGALVGVVSCIIILASFLIVFILILYPGQKFDNLYGSWRSKKVRTNISENVA